MPPSPTVARSRLLALGALLVIPTLFAYIPSLRNGFVWDDDAFFTANPLIKAPDGLFRFWCTTQPADYWPVSSSTMWFEWRLWGMHAAGYHVTNLLLHGAEVLLLWGIFRRLRVPGAWLGALLFALHPVNVESVAWITQRKNLMALLFIELCLLAFLKEEDERFRTGPGERRTARWYWLGLAAYVLALLSKGSALIVPAVLLGIAAWRRPLTVRDLVRLVPHGVLTVVFTGVNIVFQQHSPMNYTRPDGPVARLLGAASVVWFYLWKAVLPLHLLFVYPQWQVRPGDFLWWIPLLAALGLTAVLWRWRRTWSRPALFAWLYFCAALIPVMGFTDVHFMQYSLVADHYQHLALIAVCAGAAAVWTRWRNALAPRSRAVPTAAAAAAVCLLAGLTWRQERIYRDTETIFRTTLAANPACWMAHNNLGALLAEQDRTEESLAQFREARRENPGDLKININLGAELMTAGRLDAAIQQDLAVIHMHPESPEVHTNLANALVMNDRPSEAIAQYKEALRLAPGFPLALKNLGIVSARLRAEAASAP